MNAPYLNTEPFALSPDAEAAVRALNSARAALLAAKGLVVEAAEAVERMAKVLDCETDIEDRTSDLISVIGEMILCAGGRVL